MRLIFRALLALTFVVGLGWPVVTMGDVQEADAAQTSCGYWLNGVDLSNYQPSVNFPVLAKNVAFTYLEEGDGSWSSPVFSSQTAGSSAAGLPWGAYLFAEPSTNLSTATNDAFTFVAHGGASGVLPPVLDTETSNGLSASQVVAWDSVWINEVQNLTHRPVMIYTGAYPWAYSTLNAYPLWIAAYPSGYSPVQSACGLSQPSTFGWSSWLGWQFTSSASVAGVPGLVDKDVFDPTFFETYVGATIAPGGVVYGPGSIGPAVTSISKILDGAGLYSGTTSTYDTSLYTAVQAWQVKLGLTPDGSWGPSTATKTTALLSLLAHTLHLPQPPLHAGNHGWDVHRLQLALKALGYKVPTHGFYLASTVAAVAKFNNTCPGTHGWPGKAWHTHQNNCLAFYLGLKHKEFVR